MMKYCQPLFLIFFLASIVHKMMKDDGIMTILYNHSPVVMATLACQSTLVSPRLAVHAWQSSSNGTYSCFISACTNHCVSASNTFRTI